MMYEIITLELIYSSHAWRLVSPNHRGAATLGLVLAVLLCTTQDLLVSSSPLRSVCSTAGTPPRVSVKSCPDILSDTNSGFYSIRYLANTHCCPSHTTPAFLMVGWVPHRTCQNPHMPTPVYCTDRRQRSVA